MPLFLTALIGVWYKIKARGGPKRMFHFYRRILKRNQISVIMALVILGMSFTIINLNFKINKLKDYDKIPVVAPKLEYVDCDKTDGVSVSSDDVPLKSGIPPDTPTSPTSETKVIVPSLRRHTVEKLQELERMLEEYES